VILFLCTVSEKMALCSLVNEMKNDFCDMTDEEKSDYYEMIASVEIGYGHENTAKEFFEMSDEIRRNL
jgi:hypothetical protein